MTTNNLKYSTSLIYISIPVLLITGPFLPDLSVVIIGLIFVVNEILNKNLKIFKNNYFLLFLFFYLIILSSSFLSSYFAYSLRSSVPYIRFGIFALSIFLLISYNESILKKVTIIFIIILFTLFFDSIFELLFNKNIFGWKITSGSNFRITSFFGDDEVLGSYVSRFFPLILSLIMFCKEKNYLKINNLIIFLIIIMSFIITLISGERTAFALILLSFILTFLTCKSLRKTILYSLATLLFLSSIILSIHPDLKKRMYNSVISQMGLSKSSERIKIFSKVYEGHYIISHRMFLEKPILGHGVKSFRKYCAEPENYLNETACTTHPHNIYMQLLAETGLIGFLFIFSLFIMLSLKLLRFFVESFKIKENYMQQSKALIYIFYFVNLFPLLPSGNFFNNWLSIIYFYPSGYFIYLNNYKLNK